MDLETCREKSRVPDVGIGMVRVTPGGSGGSLYFDTFDLVCLAFHRDTDTLVGLPRPIHESVKTLKQVTRVGTPNLPNFLHSNR